jgi:hypothetical protein
MRISHEVLWGINGFMDFKGNFNHAIIVIRSFWPVKSHPTLSSDWRLAGMAVENERTSL